MVIFRCYVSLPEGTYIETTMVTWLGKERHDSQSFSQLDQLRNDLFVIQQSDSKNSPILYIYGL